MKILVIGKVASITHWLEDCVAAWRAEGHQVRVAASRNPAIPLALEAMLLSPASGAPLARRIAAGARRFSPNLIVAIGAFHVPAIVLEHLAAWPGRPPVLGWVGDRFDPTAARSAALLDAVLYTDRGLLARHGQLGFGGRAYYLPHAANPFANSPAGRQGRGPMVFIGNPTDHRRAVVRGLRSPIALYGPGWSKTAGVAHEIVARRIGPQKVRQLYRQHLAALNIPNEVNVMTGLNQRNFDPCLAGAPVVAEFQADIEACFEPGREVLVFRDVDELNAIHDRLLAHPEEAAQIGAAGRDRVLADHTYRRRLEAMMALT
jgi:spore maturation protein CgeB